ncbi:MAG: hypothetical protein ACREMZ_11080 [Gemmatimonadales bacterium]
MRSNFSLARVVGCVATMAGLAGCYKYTPLATTDPAPGARISVELTPAGTDTLARFVGPNATGIDGRVVQSAGTDLLLAALVIRKRNGEEEFWKGEMVSIPRGVISGLRQRRLAIGRTLLLAGAVAVVGATVGVAARSGGSGGGGNGGGPPPTE